MERLLKAVGVGALVCIVLAIAIFICGAFVMLLKYMGLSNIAVIFTTLFAPLFIGTVVIVYKYW